MADRETVKVAEKETVEMADRDTVEMADRDTVEMADRKTVEMADRERNLREKAAELRDDMRAIASDLDYHLRNSRIAGVTGRTVAVTSGVAATIGFALSPFTLGISALAVGVTFTIVGAVGGVTAGGASIVRTFIKRKKVKRVQEKWSAFQQALTDDLTLDPEALRKLNEKWKTIGSVGMNGAGIAFSVGGATFKTVRAALKGARAFAPFASVAAHVGLSVGSAFLIVPDLADMIYTSVQLHKKNGCETGNALRKLSDALDEFSQTGECSASAIEEIVVECETTQQE